MLPIVRDTNNELLPLLGRKPGDNLTIMNAFYAFPKKDPKTGIRSKDYVTIIYKDNNTGKKYHETIYEPQYTYYLLKPEYQPPTFNMHFIETEKVDPITCPYSQITRSIAEHTGNLDLFNRNIKNGDYKLNRVFFTHPRVFSADMPILNFIRCKFAETYQNPVCDIDIFFFDTEADIINASTDNIIIGECPTIMISGFYTKNKTMYTYIMRHPDIPDCAKLEQDLKKNLNKFKERLDGLILDNVRSKEKIKQYGLDNIKLEVKFFDTEAELIIAFFELIKALSPDFSMAYNMAYDMPQLVARGNILGLDMSEVICDRDFENKFCEYFVDVKNADKFEERCDYASIASYTTYIDQMILYASRRKGQSAIPSYKLETVGDIECGVHKLDYHHITTNIAKFPYLDFVLFVLYNMIDVIDQVCVEAQTGDLKYMFNNAIEMNTPYQKIWRQTVYLATKGADFYKNHEGVILGENINKFGEPPEDKFPGAFVADPNLISNKNKMLANGKYINKFNNTNDFDYKRLYPSLLQEFNMAPHTQVGKIEPSWIGKKDPEYLKMEPGGTFTENLASFNYIEFCERWMSLAGIEEMLKDVEEYFTTYRTPMFKGPGELPYDKSAKNVVYFVDKTAPVVFCNVPIPEWIEEEVNKHRASIKLN